MDVTGSTPGSVLFTTYNVLDLGADDSAAGAEHYKAVVESIQALRTDVSPSRNRGRTSPRPGSCRCGSPTTPPAVPGARPDATRRRRCARARGATTSACCGTASAGAGDVPQP